MTATGILSGIIGRQILNQAIIDASHSVYTIFGTLIATGNDYKDVLNEIDLLHDIKMIEAHVIVLPINYKNPLLTQSIYGIHEMLLEIRRIMVVIDNKISEHSTKWFYTWRRIDIQHDVIDLKQKHKILLKRYSQLLDIIKL